MNVYESSATIHVVRIADELGRISPGSLKVLVNDTIRFRPFGIPEQNHVIKSAILPAGVESFQYDYKLPADTIVDYVVKKPGSYTIEVSFPDGPATLYLTAENLKNTINVGVWDTYMTFVPQQIEYANVGDTILWTPYLHKVPIMTHSITSTSIPKGAPAFDYIFKAPADTVFSYVLQVPGIYKYYCTYHGMHMDGVIMVDTANATKVAGNSDALAVSYNAGIYPNPCKEKASVYSSFKDYTLEIVDMNGQRKIMQNNCNTLSDINTENFSPGIYFVLLTDTDNNKVSLKLVKE